MPLPTQTAEEEFTERLGETASAPLMIPTMIATDDYRRNQHAARKRVDDAHKMMVHSLGMGEVVNGKGEHPQPSGDDMGDIIYTGDITVTPGTKLKLGTNTTLEAEEEKPADHKPSTTPTDENKPPAKPNKLNPWLLPLACLALGGGTGLAGLAIGNWMNKPAPIQPTQPPVVSGPDSNWRLDGKVRDHQ